MPLAPLLVKAALEVLARAVRQEKETKSMHIRREVKFPFTLYLPCMYGKKKKIVGI